MKITSKAFGRNKSNIPVTEYTLTNASGASVSVMDLGATVTKIVMPDRDGNLGDVALGYDDAMAYQTNSGYLGGLVGRHGNRIGGATFALEGVEYHLEPNTGKHNLHGGPDGFGFRMFTVKETKDGLVFSLDSPDDDQGFPGALHVEATYALSDDNAFSITYRATTDQTTIVNLTNHSYFNLDGHASGDIKDMTLQVLAGYITEVDDDLIPTGKLIPTADVAYGFQTPTRLGDVLDHPDAAMQNAKGVDFNYCAGRDREYKLIATLYSPKTGREMQTLTDMPGVQVYTGQGLHQAGKGGIQYQMYGGICLETQRYPDAVHHPYFPSVVLRPEEVYYTKTTYRFSAR